jgi:ketosteroid isomerase-like protein
MRYFIDNNLRRSNMDIRQIIERYHSAADEFSRGNPQPVKMIYSHQKDVTLANPFGPAVSGWDQVSKALDYASSRFREGKVLRFDSMAEYISAELVTILEIEKWTAKVGAKEELKSFDLRVTSTFRHENGSWKLVHRHADPIATFHPEGPLRV